jgi:XRE family transcriptional regulator, thiamine biosynthesis regulator
VTANTRMDGLFCFNLQERLMPHVRAQTARRLAEQGLKQSRIAEHLGVSQAMVSKYLRAVPRPPQGITAPALQAVIDRAVASAMDEERRGRLPAWCPVCPEVWARGAGPGHATLLDECLRGDAPPAKDEGQAVLENVRAATERLRHAPFARLAPQVSVNVAMATRDAHDARGVAAIPGRLVEVHGELRAVGEPEFGASHHLSHILLRVRRTMPQVRAVVCLKDDAGVRQALRAAKLRFEILSRKRGDLVVAIDGSRPLDALIDPGDFGIEPITYLFGTTAVDVVDKAGRILEQLPLKEIA